MGKVKLFISAPFSAKHNDFNKESAQYALRNDIRTKILGNVDSFLFKKGKNKTLSINKNITYMGGYYFYNNIIENNQDSLEKIVDIQMSEIDKSNLVIVIINKLSAISTITELLYAAYKNKKIVIFADPKICKLDINSKYWYPIQIAKKFDDNITFIQYNNYDKIIKYIEDYEDSEELRPPKYIIDNIDKTSKKNFCFMPL